MPPPPPILCLPDELIEEVFFRLPPDEPEHLACKLWLRLLTGPNNFRRRYRDFHGGAPPMMGFLYSWVPFSRLRSEDTVVPQFFPTTKFVARIPDDGFADPDSEYAVLDCRHGRVLLGDYGEPPMSLVVWDPITGHRTKLELEAPKAYNMSPDTFINGAAVVCAVAGCDHRACHQGPSRVVIFGIITDHRDHSTVHVQVSSPETGEWSDPCPGLDLGMDVSLDPLPPVCIQDTFYFMYGPVQDSKARIFSYHLGSNRFSLIDAPPRAWSINAKHTILMAMKDGSLGFAQVENLTLYLWSRQMMTSSHGLASSYWTTQPRLIHLNNLLPIQDPDKWLRLIGSVEGSDIIFVTTDLGIYQIHLNSLRFNKLWKREKFFRLIPYMTFHFPQYSASK